MDMNASGKEFMTGERPGAKHALLVRTCGHVVAVPLEHIIEIMRPLPTESLSGAPQFVRGVAIIRGRAVPVVELAALLSDDRGATATRFVTLRLVDRVAALAVEEVLGIRDLTASCWDEIPLLGHARADAIGAIATLDAQLLLLLDSARVIPAHVWEALGAGGGAP